ncbi:SDR family NAD(P)-dependent oxidoreductase [Leifsonia naganoensis]|uniref:Dihydroanticapsin dehydrogenase n=1 Tax=Leifsonia naganoensis TaxID=150025 RepID=A0A853DHC7_9MICO|nr:SDR family oxidoreductase [Leifsonia naganoensis]NYK08496.1 dihydroanticapsin dehydrogenase [Leifsonia naganoensis]
MELGLAGLSVIVTGAASGIGRATALAFAREGARVALLDRDEAGLRTLQAELRASGIDSAVTLPVDVTDESSVRSAVGEAAAALDGVDVVVACAGVSGPFGSPVDEIALEAWNAVLAVNVTGPFLLVKHALPHLRRSEAPAIVLLASDSSFVAAPGMVPYNASKGAVLQLMRALSVDLAADGVRVNAVCPSIVDTPMARADLGVEPGGFAGADFPVQTAEEVARHVLYLASTASRPVNGHALVSDFGYLARSSFPA